MFLLFILILIVFPLKSNFLTVPAGIRDKAIYHVRVKQLSDLSCGYNALFNACKLEHLFGFKESQCNFEKFKQICHDYAKKLDRPTSAGLSCYELENIVIKLQLKCVTFLVDENNRIIPKLDEYAVRAAPDMLPDFLREQLAEENFRIKEASLLDKLKSNLSKKGETILHFICFFDDHMILISIVQKNKKERVLYIFDNCNEQIAENSKAKKFIDFLSTEFNVSLTRELAQEWDSYRFSPSWPMHDKV